MSGLRESKKQSTRASLADAAATILLTSGFEALTVAHVSKLAGVSTRTFHNYFSGLDEAILEYVVHSLYIPCTFLPKHCAAHPAYA